MRFLFAFLVTAATAAFAQDRFTAPDDAMSPALRSGTSYAVVSVDSLIPGRIVVFNRNGQQVARRVVGTPTDKTLTIDPSFENRSQSNWQFVSLVEDRIVWLHKNTPMNANSPPAYVRDLSDYTIVLQMALSDYEAAPQLGQGRFYVHADNHTGTFQDSREWGTIAAEDFVGVIMPSQEQGP